MDLENNSHANNFVLVFSLVCDFAGNMIGDRVGVSWENLPPSLKPPPEGGYPSLPFVDWG